jgi:hypothetical protein
MSEFASGFELAFYFTSIFFMNMGQNLLKFERVENELSSCLSS